MRLPSHLGVRFAENQRLSWGADRILRLYIFLSQKKGGSWPRETCVIRSLVVGDTPIGQRSANGLAVSNAGVWHASVGLDGAVLGFEQRTTLLLLLLDVLEDSHERLHSARGPVACPGSICDPFESNAILILPEENLKQ